MAAPGSILGQIGESFETIAQDVGHEVIQAPKDMVGSALESVGLTTGGKKKPQQQQQSGSPEPGAEAQPQPPGPSEEMKRAIARAALEELSGKKPQKEQSVWEKLQQEEQQKKEMDKKRKEQSRQALPKSGGKRPRGDLYGVKAKKTAAENRNIRQD